MKEVIMLCNILFLIFRNKNSAGAGEQQNYEKWKLLHPFLTTVFRKCYRNFCRDVILLTLENQLGFLHEEKKDSYFAWLSTQWCCQIFPFPPRVKNPPIRRQMILSVTRE